MTSDDRRQEERRLDDERCVDALLAEGGFPDDAELRAVLLQLRSFRVTEVPPPSAELAALMGQPFEADVVRLDDWSRRHPRRRAVFTTLAVAASLGVAGGAAAGNETLRSQAEGTISSIVRSFSPPTPGTPAPPPPSPVEAPDPAPAVVPSPGWTTPTAAVPAAPATVRGSGAERSVPAQPAKPPIRGAQEAVKAKAPAAVPPAAGKRAEPGGNRPATAPSRAAEPPGSPADGPGKGKAKGQAADDGNPGQVCGQPAGHLPKATAGR
ncbi:hypothetical protein QFZ23_001265 [Arthrobacter globiformis]|uniref:hypothetical protein n=1 Tax=Arthrobacter globiformis TaxID=1665 RepID=UPI00277EBDB6|nr:hypothetical protein [Arthrobacter globiformis]MDQ1057364.1 hypothetical protein [Arthrobacter globiformis]